MATLLLSGCATIVAPSYSPNFESIDRLKKLSLGKVAVGEVQPRDPNALVNRISLRGLDLKLKKAHLLPTLKMQFVQILLKWGYMIKHLQHSLMR